MVEISADFSSEDQQEIIIIIKDTGIGMSQDELTRAFDLFYQGEPANHHSRSGSGVGLSLCRKALESIDAVISCQSEPGLERNGLFGLGYLVPLVRPSFFVKVSLKHFLV